MPIVFEKPPHQLCVFRTHLTDRKHGPCGVFDEGVTWQARKHNCPSSWTSNAPTTLLNMRLWSYIYYYFEVAVLMGVQFRSRKAGHSAAHWWIIGHKCEVSLILCQSKPKLSEDHTFSKIAEQESKGYGTDRLRSQVPRRDRHSPSQVNIQISFSFLPTLTNAWPPLKDLQYFLRTLTLPMSIRPSIVQSWV